MYYFELVVCTVYRFAIFVQNFEMESTYYWMYPVNGYWCLIGCLCFIIWNYIASAITQQILGCGYTLMMLLTVRISPIIQVLSFPNFGVQICDLTDHRINYVVLTVQYSGWHSTESLSKFCFHLTLSLFVWMCNVLCIMLTPCPNIDWYSVLFYTLLIIVFFSYVYCVCAYFVK